MKSAYKIFAYGSLINQASLKQTVPEARNIIPAKTHGLRRVFNLASNYRFDDQQKRPVCVLNLTESKADSMLNGTCFEMDEVSIKQLLEREKGYQFCRIEAQHYHQDQVFEAHYFRAHQFSPYQYLAKSTTQQHYLNLCLQGSQQYGEIFIQDFKNSTDFWGIENQQDLQAIWSGSY